MVEKAWGKISKTTMNLAGSYLAERGFQLKGNIVFACNGIGLKNMLFASRQWLEAHVNVVNGLNVFPVPDGDTGTNMLLTLNSALREVEAMTTGHAAGMIAAAAAHGALMGARGNSGVILSQFLEGMAAGLAGREIFTTEDFVQAVRLGTEKAYQSVVKPVEGTILTVARQVAETAQQRARTTPDFLALLTDMVAAAQLAQARTPELLPVLKEAGVTDSGGQGFVYILEGMLRWMTNQPVDIDPAGEIVPVLQSTLGAEDEAYGYDVQFLIQGERLDVEAIRAHIDKIGWSTVVVGDERTVKVHVHTPDPGIPLSYGVSQGSLTDVVVENMAEQAKQFVQEHAVDMSHMVFPPSFAADTKAGKLGQAITNIAIVGVVPGQGLARIFQSLGASQVLSGGQTMNPSTQELLDAINNVEADNVLVLPNNSNIILAAQQAQTLSAKSAMVIPTRTIPQGIAALLAFNYQADLATNVQRMGEAAQKTQTIEVTRAVRSTTVNGFSIRAGDIIGFFNNKLISVGQDYDSVTLDVLTRAVEGGLAEGQANEHEVVTIYFGKDSSRPQAEVLAGKIGQEYPDYEVEIHEGGQPHYHYIISLE